MRFSGLVLFSLLAAGRAPVVCAQPAPAIVLRRGVVIRHSISLVPNVYRMRANTSLHSTRTPSARVRKIPTKLRSKSKR